MGRPRVKVIDDSQPVEVKKPQVRHGNQKQEDSLVAKLKEELGIEEKQQPENTPEVKSGLTEDVILGSETTPESKKEDSGQTRMTKPVKTQEPGKAKPRSKKYLEASKDLDRSKYYPLSEALDTIKKLSYSKFDGTLEAHINTRVTGIRGLVSLPFASGKKLRILAFGKDSEKSGADISGDDSTLENISKGKIEFDILITNPEWMPKLAKAAKILGPKGLMPNPKSGTITEDLKKAVEFFQAGKTEYKTETKAKVIHLGIGKLSQPNEELEANIKTLYQVLGKSRISKITLSPTMGSAVKLDLSSI